MDSCLRSSIAALRERAVRLVRDTVAIREYIVDRKVKFLKRAEASKEPGLLRLLRRRLVMS